MVGLSLSRCVKDILLEKVDIANVDMIITGTNFETPSQWEEGLENYLRWYWNKDVRAIAIVAQLLHENKIVQPRTKGERQPDTRKGYWLQP